MEPSGLHLHLSSSMRYVAHLQTIRPAWAFGGRKLSLKARLCSCTFTRRGRELRPPAQAGQLAPSASPTPGVCSKLEQVRAGTAPSMRALPHSPSPCSPMQIQLSLSLYVPACNASAQAKEISILTLSRTYTDLPSVLAPTP